MDVFDIVDSVGGIATTTPLGATPLPVDKRTKLSVTNAGDGAFRLVLGGPNVAVLDKHKIYLAGNDIWIERGSATHYDIKAVSGTAAYSISTGDIIDSARKF